MACASVRLSSGGELRCNSIGMRRSSSAPALRYSLDHSKSAYANSTKLKTSCSIGIFPLSGSVVDTEKGMRFLELDEGDLDEEEVAFMGSRKRVRVNWVERLLELRQQWRDRQLREADGAEKVVEDYHGHCDVSYDEVEVRDEREMEVFDEGSFSKYLVEVPWTTTKLFSQLAFLCNMAYVIPELKADDLKRYYNLDWVTSSLEKKFEGVTIINKLEADSCQAAPTKKPLRKRRIRPSVAHQIAASAASYVHSQAKGFLSFRGEHHEPVPPPGRIYKSEVAACMAASTMTAVVAVKEEAKQEAANDLRSLHSSPCEWFICDNHSTCTRCFVIQGSDSLASWQANLFFEPTKFEETNSLVHRGIYEAAKGIYDQFLPEIISHLERYGDSAKFRFTGHSLGGSLSLLINLMLLARGVVDRSKLLPVVTFGSPYIFCGGHRVLEELSFEEEQVFSVMMHRDIVPRAFSCNYPNHVSQILKRLNGTFRSHPCLNNEKMLYSPLGQLFVLQPDEKSSPSHPFLPAGSSLYALDKANGALGNALKAFLNNPHPLETLSDRKAYGSDGTILRDHDSGNYLKAVNSVLRQQTKSMIRSSRMQRLQHWWPMLTTAADNQSWNNHHRWHLDEAGLMAAKEVVSGG